MRIKELDILKGLAIVLIVLGHCNFPFKHFIYLFHVAVFIMCSGYFYKPSYSENTQNLKKYIFKKAKKLYIPYVVCNIIFLLFNNIFFKLNIYSTNYDNNIGIITSISSYIKRIILILSFHGSPQLGGATWFLQALFGITCLYALIDYFITKISQKHHLKMITQLLIGIIFNLIGFFCSLKHLDLMGLERIFSMYILFHFGLILSQKKLIPKNKKFIGLELIITFTILLIATYFGKISLAQNNFENPIFLIIVSLAGWIFLYIISLIISNISILYKLFELIGKNTLPIMILHFLSFKVINLLSVKLFDYPSYMIASFPVLMTDGLWWILYTIVGIFIPICCNQLYNISKNTIIKFLKKFLAIQNKKQKYNAT